MKKTLLLDKIQSRLKKTGLKFETTSDIIHFNMEIDNIVGKVAVFIQASENTILSYAVINNKIPKEQYNSVSEYLHLANYGLLYGNFEMDFNDGEIRYKLAIDCQDVANIPTISLNIISTTNENARTVKYKVQRVLEELLFEEIREKMNN